MVGLQHKHLIPFWVSILVSGVFLLLVYLLGYCTQQSEFVKIGLLYFSLFALLLFLIKFSIINRNINSFILLGILARAMLLFSYPNLSDDYLRFIWDGQLSLHNINPFGFLPSEIIERVSAFMPSDSAQLALSKNYYSVYPPVLQGIFALAVWVSAGSSFWAIVIMKCFILLFEILSIFLIIRILKLIQLPTAHVLWYALNPLPIIEYSGNLHFEAAMICFLLASIYVLMSHRLLLAAFFFSLAISSKILPLMFLPFLWRRIGTKNWFLFITIAFSLCIIWFIPFLGHLSFNHLMYSLGLYFNHFEFNASIYYVFRWVELTIFGFYDPATTGFGLSLLVLISILYFVIRDKRTTLSSLFPALLFSYICYYLLASTVNPWYLGPIIIFSLFTQYKVWLIWPVLAVLSYHAFYFPDYKELSWMLWIEYTPIYLLVILTFLKNKTDEPQSLAAS